MRILDLVGLALWGGRSHPLRTCLLALTLGGGVAAVVVTVAVAQGFQLEIERASFGAYSRALVISENIHSNDQYGPPRSEDLERLLTEVEWSGDVEAAVAWRAGSATIYEDRRLLNFTVFGVRGDYRLEADMPIIDGRQLTAEETRGADRVCLVGRAFARELTSSGPVLGRTILISGVGCEVVGVFGAPNSRTAYRFSEGVITPLISAGRYFSANPNLAPNELSWMTIVFEPSADLHANRIAADRKLRRLHGVPQSQPSPFLYADPSAPVDALEQQRNLLAALLSAVTAVSLLAASVGYGAMMWGIMSMRRRSIAIQMATGAMASEVLTQYLLESAVIGLLGGALGITLGWAICSTLSTVWQVPVMLNFGIGALALAVGGLIGVVAGALPATLAAQTPPALAARS